MQPGKRQKEHEPWNYWRQISSKLVQASVLYMKMTAIVELLHRTPFQLHGVVSELFQLLRTPAGSIKPCLKDCSSNPAVPLTNSHTYVYKWQSPQDNYNVWEEKTAARSGRDNGPTFDHCEISFWKQGLQLVLSARTFGVHRPTDTAMQYKKQ